MATKISKRSWSAKRLVEENRACKASGVVAFLKAPSIAYEVHGDATVTSFLPDARRTRQLVWLPISIEQHDSVEEALAYAERNTEWFRSAAAVYA